MSALWRFFFWQALRAQVLGRAPKSRAAVRGYELVDVRSGRWLDSFPEDEDLLFVAAYAHYLATDYGVPVEVRFNGRYVGTVYPSKDGFSKEVAVRLFFSSSS